VAKSSDSLTADTAGTGRSERAKEALRLVRKEPVVGVGPGLYVIALRDVEHQLLLPAHDVVLHEAAEGGVLAGVLSLVALLAFGLRALRRGVASLCCFLSLAPFFVFDSYPYVFATGLVVAALWVGLVELAGEPQ
jgi:O-antigen ligase